MPVKQALLNAEIIPWQMYCSPSGRQLNNLEGNRAKRHLAKGSGTLLCSLAVVKLSLNSFYIPNVSCYLKMT